jgi:putative transposase
VPDVKKYIECQADHHHRMTFQDELPQLLARHGMKVDDRCAWS